MSDNSFVHKDNRSTRSNCLSFTALSLEPSPNFALILFISLIEVTPVLRIDWPPAFHQPPLQSLRPPPTLPRFLLQTLHRLLPATTIHGIPFHPHPIHTLPIVPFPKSVQHFLAPRWKLAKLHALKLPLVSIRPHAHAPLSVLTRMSELSAIPTKEAIPFRPVLNCSHATVSQASPQIDVVTL